MGGDVRRSSPRCRQMTTFRGAVKKAIVHWLVLGFAPLPLKKWFRLY